MKSELDLVQEFCRAERSKNRRVGQPAGRGRKDGFQELRGLFRQPARLSRREQSPERRAVRLRVSCVARIPARSRSENPRGDGHLLLSRQLLRSRTLGQLEPRAVCSSTPTITLTPGEPSDALHAEPRRRLRASVRDPRGCRLDDGPQRRNTAVWVCAFTSSTRGPKSSSTATFVSYLRDRLCRTNTIAHRPGWVRDSRAVG